MILYSETNWSENYGDLIYQEEIKLLDILPRVGETLNVSVCNFGSEIRGKVFLLWCPPASEVNGWMCHPSEIESSYLVGGVVSKSVGEHYKCKVESVVPITDALEKAIESNDFNFPACMEMDGSSFILWERARSLEVANIGPYTYLSGSECETSLECILVVGSADITLLYHSYHPPATPEDEIARYRLSRDEVSLFKGLIQKADSIIETGEPYLV